MDGGHEPLNNAILVVDHLCQRSKAVGGTGGVAREKGDNQIGRVGTNAYVEGLVQMH